MIPPKGSHRWFRIEWIYHHSTVVKKTISIGNGRHCSDSQLLNLKVIPENGRTNPWLFICGSRQFHRANNWGKWLNFFNWLFYHGHYVYDFLLKVVYEAQAGSYAGRCWMVQADNESPGLPSVAGNLRHEPQYEVSQACIFRVEGLLGA